MGKKVLLVFNRFYPVLSGSEKFSKMIFDNLKERGFEVDVFTLRVSDDSYRVNDLNLKREENIKGSIIKRFSLIDFQYKNRIFKFFENYGILKYYSLNFKIVSPSLILNLKKNILKYDIVITGFLPFTSVIYPALYYSKKYKKKSILIPLLHSTVPQTERFTYEFFHPYYKSLYEMADILICLNSAEKEHLKNFGNKIFYLNSYIDIPEKVSTGGNGIFKILTIGRQNYEKGIETSIKAVKLLYAEFKNIKFTIVGKIDEKYLRIIKKEEFIEYHPYVTDEEKEDLFLKTDIFILPSIAEAFGIVSIEAHSYGVPTINSYCWGSTYIVKNGLNGFLIPFGDYLLTYNYLKQIYINKKLKKRLSENARNISLKGSDLIEGYCEGPFNKKRFNKQLDKILENLL